MSKAETILGLQKKTKKQLTHKKQCDIVISLSQDSKIIILYALLAQLAEHLTLNQCVQGSNPWRRTESPRLAVKSVG